MPNFTNVTASAASNVTCYYSQIAECGSMPAFQTAGGVIAVFDWVTVVMGVCATVLSYFSRPQGSSKGLTPFEVFLTFYTGCAFFIAIGITWSVAFGMHTVVLHTFHSIGDCCAGFAAYVLLNMCLKISGANSPVIDNLRVWVLPFFLAPVTLLLVFYMAQGYLSDLVQFSPNGSDYVPTFNLVIMLVGVTFIFTLGYLIAFLIIARRTFKKALQAVRDMHGSRGSENGSSFHRRSSISGNGTKNYTTTTSTLNEPMGDSATTLKRNMISADAQNARNVKLALKSAISMMGSIALGCTFNASYIAVYIYTLFSKQGQSSVIFILTLIGVYSVLVLIGFVVFLIQIIGVVRKVWGGSMSV